MHRTWQQRGKTERKAQAKQERKQHKSTNLNRIHRLGEFCAYCGATSWSSVTWIQRGGDDEIPEFHGHFLRGAAILHARPCNPSRARRLTRKGPPQHRNRLETLSETPQPRAPGNRHVGTKKERSYIIECSRLQRTFLHYSLSQMNNLEAFAPKSRKLRMEVVHTKMKVVLKDGLAKF